MHTKTVIASRGMQQQANIIVLDIATMIIRPLVLVAVLAWPTFACALNASDVGTYAIVHVDGHVTDKQFRVQRSEMGWTVEERRPDGSWEDVTCTSGCAMVESSQADVERFLGKEKLKNISAECIHDSAFAFCRTTSKVGPGRREYLFVALTEKQPVTLRLSRVSLENTWRDKEGNVAPNTESRSSINGFAGWILVTSDADWEKKWKTPSSTVPHFSEAKTVPKGKKVFLLMFFSNPQLDGGGRANVTCDVDIVQPDGSISSHNPDLVCFRGEIAGNPNNMYLSAPVVAFVGEPKDPAGLWLVRVTLKDNSRHVVLPLKTSFTLQ